VVFVFSTWAATERSFVSADECSNTFDQKLEVFLVNIRHHVRNLALVTEHLNLKLGVLIEDPIPLAN